MKKGAHCPEGHKENFSRGIAKAKRNKGLLAMEEAGMAPAEWAQKFDPLFKVKGITRHLSRNAPNFWRIRDQIAAKGGK